MNDMMNNEGVQRIKEAGLKLTPQRREVYEAMQELRHATVEDIIERVQSHNREVTVSTIYRILESFRSANILSFFYHPDTGKCYYDITVAEHHHLFDGGSIEDYADPELSHIPRTQTLPGAGDRKDTGSGNPEKEFITLKTTLFPL